VNSNDDCDKSKFKPPVGWLLGRELLAGLKWIAAYTFMGDKQDPKDWMITGTITPPQRINNTTDSYWFDYIADTGDGMSAVYNIAYLCMSELWVDTQFNLTHNSVALTTDGTHTEYLPRGEFLFVGGDTAYHIADTASLKERFQIPFNCAYTDLNNLGKSIDKRPIYGVPANHDYYDALDGFNRQFCKPISEDTTFDPMENDEKDPQLGLMGFERTQTASYVALELPFNWRLWGLDSQDGKMDKRQQAFFVSTFHPELVKKGELFNKNNKDKVLKELQERAPDKLIVTTPEPSTVFGKWAKPDAPIVKTFERLGLELSFLQDKCGNLSKGKCRLDISGDIHHYERYWGSNQNDPEPVNYASVVAGGGGAFLHPSHTDVNEVAKQKEFPSRKDSHRLTTETILKPWNIFQGGYIWLAGGFIAFMSYFAVTIPQSTWSLFRLMPEYLRPPLANQEILSQIRSALDVPTITQSLYFCSNDYCFDLFYIVLFIILLGIWLWKTPAYLTAVKDSDAPEWRKSILLFMLPVLAGIILLLTLIFLPREKFPHPFLASLLIDFFFVAAVLIFSLSRRYSDILLDRARLHREIHLKLMPSWVYSKFGIIPEVSFESIPLWVYNLLGISYAAFGFLRYGVYTSAVMTFDLLTAIVWFLSTLGLVALAVILGGQLQNATGKIRFAAIGVWHAILQVTVPVCLVLYADWTTILIVSVIAFGITLLAGKLFTLDFLVKDFTLSDQKKIGNLLFAAWGITGIFTLLAASWGEPIAVDGWRLVGAFLLGALFSCIWFGWYLAVSLAFHGHNNEAGGGARSEQYRHMIRFKLTDNSLTGYVIGVDKPETDFSPQKLPKFRLVDVFTIQVQK